MYLRIAFKKEELRRCGRVFHRYLIRSLNCTSLAHSVSRYSFVLSTIQPDTQTLLIQLKDQRKKNKIVGLTVVPITDLTDQEMHSEWHKLMPAMSNSVILSGQVKVQCVFVDDHIKVTVVGAQDLTSQDGSGTE